MAALGNITDDLLAEINEVLQTNFVTLGDAAVTPWKGGNIALKRLIRDISTSRLYKVSADSSALTIGDDSLVLPADFMETISLTPTLGTTRYDPMTLLKGGHDTWLLYKRSTGSRGTPREYHEGDGQWEIWPPAGSAFVIEEVYWAKHPTSGEDWEQSLLLDARLEQLVFDGLIFYTLFMRRRYDDAAAWGAAYAAEKLKMQTTLQSESHVVDRDDQNGPYYT